MRGRKAWGPQRPTQAQPWWVRKLPHSWFSQHAGWREGCAAAMAHQGVGDDKSTHRAAFLSSKPCCLTPSHIYIRKRKCIFSVSSRESFFSFTRSFFLLPVQVPSRLSPTWPSPFSFNAPDFNTACSAGCLETAPDGARCSVICQLSVHPFSIYNPPLCFQPNTSSPRLITVCFWAGWDALCGAVSTSHASQIEKLSMRARLSNTPGRACLCVSARSPRCAMSTS